MVTGTTLGLFVGSQVLYVGLAAFSTLRRRNWEQLAIVPMAMVVLIVILFIRGSMTGRSTAGSMHIATAAALGAVVCSLGDPTRLMELEDNDEDKEQASGFLGTLRRANPYQIVFLTVGVLGGGSLYLMHSAWFD